MRQLFIAPGKGEILLLKDIGTAGIRREETQVQEPESTEHDEDSTDDAPLRHRKRGTGITLAGLLDAVDTARQGGKLLFMTNNRPEALDAARTSAGRIDRRILFGKASKNIAGKIFEVMYKGQEGEADFDDLVNSFESAILENEFTTAEIQCFLIAHSTSGATVKRLAAWVEAEKIEKDQH